MSPILPFTLLCFFHVFHTFTSECDLEGSTKGRTRKEREDKEEESVSVGVGNKIKNPIFEKCKITLCLADKKQKSVNVSIGSTWRLTTAT